MIFASLSITIIASALKLFHLAAGQLLVLGASPAAISVVVHLTLQSKPATKVLPDGGTYMGNRAKASPRGRSARGLVKTGTRSFTG